MAAKKKKSKKKKSKKKKKDNKKAENKKIEEREEEPSVLYTGVTKLGDIRYNIKELHDKIDHYHRIREEYDMLHNKADEKTSQIINKLDQALKTIGYLERNTPKLSQVRKEQRPGQEEKEEKKKEKKKSKKKKSKKEKKKDKEKSKKGEGEFVDRIQDLKKSFDQLKQDLEKQREKFYAKK